MRAVFFLLPPPQPSAAASASRERSYAEESFARRRFSDATVEAAKSKHNAAPPKSAIRHGARK